MVEDGLARGERLATHETTQAIELSQLLRRAAEISDAGHPVVREMHLPNPITLTLTLTTDPDH